MTTETKSEEITSEVQKSDDSSVTSILAQLVKSQEARIDSFEKKFDDLAELIKGTQNTNPVDSGVEAQNKPKKEDANDVGDPVTAGNVLAPSPKDQPSIIAPALETSGSDTEGLKMENKADDEEKKEEKKDEDVEKADDEDVKEESIKKSDSEYEIVKTVRPVLKSTQEDKTVPTGYQILKAIAGGFNGETSSAEEALTMAYNKLESGEFGNGLPGAY